MKIEKIATDNAPAAIGPYSQAIKAGGFLYCSGQIPLLPGKGELIQGGITEQTAQTLDNLRQVLVAAGVDFSAVVKTTIYLTDLNDFAIVNDIYAEYCADIAPARATIQVAALPKGALVEIDAVAWLG
jgi:2-iminobutanoate/2-iminopropanoate deaminase